MKRIVIISASVIIILVCFSIFFIYFTGAKPFDTIMHYEPSEKTKILFINGDNGNKTTISDPTKVKEIITILENAKVKIKIGQRFSAGYAFSLKIIEGDKEYISVIFKTTLLYFQGLCYSIDESVVGQLKTYIK